MDKTWHYDWALTDLTYTGWKNPTYQLAGLYPIYRVLKKSGMEGIYAM